MPRSGALALSDYPSDVVRLACRKCGRAGVYRKATLISRYGRHVALPDLRIRLASGCPKIANAADYCGVYFVELAAERPSV